MFSAPSKPKNEMPTLIGTTQRLELNQSSRAPTLELLSGAKLVLWQGLSARLECALFNDTPELASFVTDISNIDSVNIVVRKNGPNGNILFTKETTALNNITYAAWVADIAFQFVFELSELDTTQIVPQSGRLPIYFVVTVTTTDNVPYIAGFGFGEIQDVGYIENPISSDYITGRTPIVGGRLLTDLDLGDFRLTNGAFGGVEYREYGATTLAQGVLEFHVPFVFVKANNTYIFDLNEIEDPSDPPSDIRAKFVNKTTLGFDVRLSAAPTTGLSVLYWRVIAPDSDLVQAVPQPRYVADTDVVHRAGAEDIVGVKRFTDYPNFTKGFLASASWKVVTVNSVDDATVAVAAAISELPSTGGIVYVLASSGVANFTSDPLAGITKPVVLNFGPGIYTIYGSTYFVTIRGNQKIVGAGEGLTTLKVGTTVGQKDSFIRMESGTIDSALSNLTLDGSLGATAFNCAVRISGATRPKIHDVRIFGFVSTIANVHVEDSYRGDFDNVLIESDRATLPGNPHCHGFQIWNATPTDNYHKLNGVRVIGGGFGFHFVQANRNMTRMCSAVGIIGGLPTLEGMNLDSCNDNDLEIYTYYRGDAGYLETNNENFPGSPVCARNKVSGRIEGSSYDGASINSIDSSYHFVSINNGRQSGWAGAGPTHGVYVGSSSVRATIHVEAYDNQTVATQTDGVYVAASAADTRIFAGRLRGMANQIVDLGTNTSASYWDEASAKQILLGDIGFPARDTVISLARSGVNINGKNLTLQAGDGDIHAGSVAGGHLYLKGGAAFSGVPGVDGGDVILEPGANQAAPGGEGRTRIYNGAGAEVGRFDGLGVTNQTPFLVKDITSGTLKRVEVGAADSAGTGFRTLRIIN